MWSIVLYGYCLVGAHIVRCLHERSQQYGSRNKLTLQLLGILSCQMRHATSPMMSCNRYWFLLHLEMALSSMHIDGITFLSYSEHEVLD